MKNLRKNAVKAITTQWGELQILKRILESQAPITAKQHQPKSIKNLGKIYRQYRLKKQKVKV